VQQEIHDNFKAQVCERAAAASNAMRPTSSIAISGSPPGAEQLLVAIEERGLWARYGVKARRRLLQLISNRPRRYWPQVGMGAARTNSLPATTNWPDGTLGTCGRM
jgi:hypothetical protein